MSGLLASIIMLYCCLEVQAALNPIWPPPLAQGLTLPQNSQKFLRPELVSGKISGTSTPHFFVRLGCIWLQNLGGSVPHEAEKPVGDGGLGARANQGLNQMALRGSTDKRSIMRLGPLRLLRFYRR